MSGVTFQSKTTLPHKNYFWLFCYSWHSKTGNIQNLNFCVWILNAIQKTDILVQFLNGSSHVIRSTIGQPDTLQQFENWTSGIGIFTV